MGRYPDPIPERDNNGYRSWMNRLTRLDLERSMTLFGFYDVHEFAGFIAHQYGKAS